MRPLSTREANRLRAARLGEVKVVPATPNGTGLDLAEPDSNAAA
jgi:hypothetical protein